MLRAAHLVCRLDNALQDHLVRIGVLGHIGRFQAYDARQFQRDAAVVCRTHRGLEFGSVLTSLQHDNSNLPRMGTIIRAATAEDHLLRARIDKNRSSAFDECQLLLSKRSVTVPLMDVEVLFDGKSIYFYFLGEITAEVEALTSELSEAYEANVQLRRFGETMTAGCGPDCGTGEGGSCGDQCSGCAVAEACAPRKLAASSDLQ